MAPAPALHTHLLKWHLGCPSGAHARPHPRDLVLPVNCQAGSAAVRIPDAQRLRLSQLAVPIVLQVPSTSSTTEKLQPQRT